jgi:hypothetical protein
VAGSGIGVGVAVATQRSPLPLVQQADLNLTAAGATISTILAPAGIPFGQVKIVDVATKSTEKDWVQVPITRKVSKISRI